jgi:4-amino-4-deoxy-L-arabinose transferase-like glycosyltransferase
MSDSLHLILLLALMAMAVFFPCLLALAFGERRGLAWKVLRVAGLPAAGLVLLPGLVFGPAAPLVYFAFATTVALSLTAGLLLSLVRAVRHFREQVEQERIHADLIVPASCPLTKRERSDGRVA